MTVTLELMHLLHLLWFMILLCCSYHVAGDICKIDYPILLSNSSAVGEADTATLSQKDELIECPRPGDPPEWTSCCFYESMTNWTDDEQQNSLLGEEKRTTCCAPDTQPMLFYFISDKMALLIAISVTAVLLIITIIVVVCCFWSVCPLYMMCRVRYRQDDIIAYASKDDETTNLNDMPPEEQKGVTIYSPNAIKVTLKDDV